MANQLADSFAGCNVPEADSAVPRGREAETTISSEADLINKVRMTGEHLGRLAPLLVLIIIFAFIELPLDQGLVARAGKKEFNFLSINLFLADSQRGNPATMTFEISLLFECVFSFAFTLFVYH